MRIAGAVTFLLASDSPAAFVRSCLVKKRDEELGVVDLYEHYQEWCRDSHLRSFPSKPFSRIAKEEIEITWGLKLRHDLAGENGKPRRGWKGLQANGRCVGDSSWERSSRGSLHPVFKPWLLHNCAAHITALLLFAPRVSIALLDK
jgi:hypothetical protein